MKTKTFLKIIRITNGSAKCNILKKTKTHLLKFASFYSLLQSQDLWFTQRWHHGDRSYFYWTVKGQLLSVHRHLPNPHQSTRPWREGGKNHAPKNDWELKGWIWYRHAMLLSEACLTSQMSFHSYWTAIPICNTDALSAVSCVSYNVHAIVFNHWSNVF